MECALSATRVNNFSAPRIRGNSIVKLNRSISIYDLFEMIFNLFSFSSFFGCLSLFHQVLSCDWSEHDENIIATGGSDGQIRGWDLRYTTSPLFELDGCEYSVRKVRFSPFDSNVLAAVSYDHTARIWNWQNDCEPIETITHHSECNYGLDWNRLVRNQMADCGWDSLVNVYTPKSLI